jgi:prepilin-type N-terminal cleavage/methylation domain-containing protein
MNIKRRQNQLGFTLIEIMVTVAIIGILTAVILAALDGARTKARDANRISEIKQLEGAIENYFSSCYKFPEVLADLNTSGCANNYKPVLSSFPKDAANNTYKYYQDDGENDDGKRFHLCAHLESAYGGKGKVALGPFASGDECNGNDSKTFDVAGGVY